MLGVGRLCEKKQKGETAQAYEHRSESHQFIFFCRRNIHDPLRFVLTCRRYTSHGCRTNDSKAISQGWSPDNRDVKRRQSESCQGGCTGALSSDWRLVRIEKRRLSCSTP